MSVEFHTDATRAKMRAAWVKRRARRPSFWDRLDVGDCWLWTGARTTQGYGDVEIEGKRWLAHRYAYEQLVGPIPKGLTIDHLCRTPACVNPDHLEPVSMRVNTLRGSSPIAANARKTHCKRGHPFDEANTRPLANGGRSCRTCGRANWRAWKDKKDANERAYLAWVTR